ncbi:glycoside hydrolase 43 family protein [Mariniflexile sp. HNIBRBA6329]|uniref:glycoside hydrolase family 43 protein n=1 Tax=Mariniflexile sp. HNIBRBA6329 TaxID=3373088 RepID=UPI003745775C
MINIKHIVISFFALLSIKNTAQIWTPDLGNGTYKNPILYADYSDPDVIRVGDDFYMVASSFNAMPGIPVLHSKDLVNWKLINHVYNKLPFEKYDKPAHGEGSWAPSIRYHKGTFFVYFCTPEDGLFMASTKNPAEKWDLTIIENVERWEDPCPLWDDDGNAYLVRGKVCANELYLHKMSKDGKQILDNGTLIFNDVEKQPIIEGPKFLKKDGYYYILAPAGSVPSGWQAVLRSKNIYGPYEDKIVLHQGNTDINGPHQGGLVALKSGEWWFMHFQSKNPFGRIVHLQPVTWKDGWPIMGIDSNNDGIGEPVSEYKKPNIGKTYPIEIPQTSDEFNNQNLGLQWQWHANPKERWSSLVKNEGRLRLFNEKNFTQNGNLWFVPNLLLQKFSSPSFTSKTKIDFHGDLIGDRSGLVVMGSEWAYIAVIKTSNGNKITVYEGTKHKCEDLTKQIDLLSLDTNTCYLKVEVFDSGTYQFSYSLDDDKFELIGRKYKAQEGVWIGAKVGLFSLNPNIMESKGYADFDWFRIE